ncbi:MAG: phosphoglycerate kinase [Pirellulales bacterium]|nr:phosphoglycerate kinase [Pirellulales bacterium]
MPTLSTSQAKNLILTLLNANPDTPKRALGEYLAAIPRLASLADVPSGTPVLVRGDVDAKPGKIIGEGDERLRSMVETLKFGQSRGWKQIIMGHIGRKPEGSLKDVAKRLGELLNCEVTLISDWWDEATQTVLPAVTATIAVAAPGSILVLENSRKYKIERVLWDATAEDAEKLAPALAKVANEVAEKIARVYVNEALSAGSLDTSSTILPAAMDRVALGSYVASEFDGPMQQCLLAELVVFSGLKIDKLDDLQAMIDRGTIKWVFAAGSLAMALRKADGELAGRPVSIGVAEDPAHADQPYFIPVERVEQAKRMLTEGRAKGITFVLPVDSILQDGRAVENIGPGEQQFDIGPKSSALFSEKVGEFLAANQARLGKENSPVAFHNGVFGMFEDPRFEEGTRKFVSELKRLKDAGVRVFVGGGEGGKALEKYGQPDWVTHCFTAGGTVLNALGSNPVPYLQALAR